MNWLTKLIGRIFGDPIETSRKAGYTFAVDALCNAQTEGAWDLAVIALEQRCRASYGQHDNEVAFCEGIKQAMSDLSDRH